MSLAGLEDRSYQLVQTAAAWSAALRALRSAKRIAVDVEADGFHRYPERVALIQVATDRGDCLLLDPLAINDLAPFGEILADATIPKVFHAADYDVRSLYRDFNFHIRGLFDSAIAAQFLGAERTGLANVVAERLGVVLDKPKRLQRLDWSLRPLPQDALDYAAADVLHLLPLHDELTARLRERGRETWVSEECCRLEQVRFAPTDPPAVAVLQLPGTRNLSDSARAILLEMFLFREQQARASGRPPYRVLASRTMVALAQETSEGKTPHLPRMAPGLRVRLEEALKRGLSAPPVPWPRGGGRNPWDSEARRRLARLKVWRTEQATALGLEAGIVWPADHLRRMALNPAADLHELDLSEPHDVRAWQWNTLGPELETAWRNGSLTSPVEAAGPADSARTSEAATTTAPEPESAFTTEGALPDGAPEP